MQAHEEKKSRFRIEKLEERIAPAPLAACHGLNTAHSATAGTAGHGHLEGQLASHGCVDPHA